MRIIAGEWGGKSLVSPSGRVRPTAEALREAWMTMIAGDLEKARILDLFAGTGSVGLEALSRGAATCDFVENAPEALHSLKANVALVRARGRIRVFARDAIPFVERLPGGRYDIALADPPYGSAKLDRVLRRWVELPFSRLLVLEHAPDHEFPDGVRGLTRRFGDSALTLFRARKADLQ